ncbi:MAG: glutathione S-transferase C-terminal domain-containing protein [Rhizobiales bacterium]|nr:glutathione S-transferase C-terminal domain-containing protein [Hyphomicrobiales bacterium]
MTTPQLYCFAQSGNAYKAALMLALTDTAWTPVFVDFFKGETRTPEYRRNVNEMGEVPVFVDDSVKLSQTGVILTYLAEQSGKFGAKSEAERREILRWILFDNHKFTSYLATYRFMHAFANSDDTAVMDFFRARIKSALGIVEKHLERQPFIVGDAPTIADLSMCGYLYYPAEEFGFDIAAAHPAIGAWLGRIKALPGWKHPYKLMPGHPLAS